MPIMLRRTKLSPSDHPLLVWKLGWKFPLFSPLHLSPALTLHKINPKKIKVNLTELNNPLRCLRRMNPQQGLCSLPMFARDCFEEFITFIRVGLMQSEAKS